MRPELKIASDWKEGGIPLPSQIKCVEREIAKREWLYPKLIKQGKISTIKAEYEIEIMKEVVKTLMNLMDKEAKKLKQPKYKTQTQVKPDRDLLGTSVDGNY